MRGRRLSNAQRSDLIKAEAASVLPSLRDLFAEVRAEIKASGITDEELGQEIDAAVKEVRTRRRA
jgi:hypothetical protein